MCSPATSAFSKRLCSCSLMAFSSAVSSERRSDLGTSPASSKNLIDKSSERKTVRAAFSSCLKAQNLRSSHRSVGKALPCSACSQRKKGPMSLARLRREAARRPRKHLPASGDRASQPFSSASTPKGRPAFTRILKTFLHHFALSLFSAVLRAFSSPERSARE